MLYYYNNHNIIYLLGNFNAVKFHTREHRIIIHFHICTKVIINKYNVRTL